MLKDIIEKPIAEIMKTLRIVGKFKTPEEVDAYFEKSLNETAQIVAREVLRKVREGAKGREIISDKKLQFVNPHIKTWEDGYNFAIDDTLTHLQSLEEELTK
jgi:hypothetical protein